MADNDQAALRTTGVETVQITDSCTGVLAELWRQPLP
jgi:hypothetical protein